MNKFALIIPIALVLLVSGCTQQGGQTGSKDPIKILEQSVANIASHDFSGIYNIEAKGVTGTMEVKNKGKNIYSKSKIMVLGAPKEAEMLMYLLTEGKNKGVFVCGDSESLGGGSAVPGMSSVCLDASGFGEALGVSTDQIDLETQLKAFVEKAKSGEMEITYSGTETIAGKACDSLKFKQLGIETEICLDRETGYQLKIDSLGTKVVLSKFGSPPIDADFVLPYDVLDIKDLLANSVSGLVSDGIDITE